MKYKVKKVLTNLIFIFMSGTIIFFFIGVIFFIYIGMSAPAFNEALFSESFESPSDKVAAPVFTSLAPFFKSFAPLVVKGVRALGVSAEKSRW